MFRKNLNRRGKSIPFRIFLWLFFLYGLISFWNHYIKTTFYSICRWFDQLSNFQVIAVIGIVAGITLMFVIAWYFLVEDGL